MNRQQKRAQKKASRINKKRTQGDHNMARMLVKANRFDSTLEKVEKDRKAERALWLAMVAMADAFGVGPERAKRFAECLSEIAREYAEMKATGDVEYADEKLRIRVSQIYGEEITNLYSDSLDNMT